MKIHAISTGQVEIKSKQVRGEGRGQLSRLFNLFSDPN